VDPWDRSIDLCRSDGMLRNFALSDCRVSNVKNNRQEMYLTVTAAGDRALRLLPHKDLHRLFGQFR
jgi:hypothetical protein